MEGMLKNSSRACREAAAGMTAWVRNTHHSLQRQEFRWEWVKQEVKDQETEIQTLMVDVRCMQNNQRRYEERLRQLESLVCKQEQALVEQGRRCESAERERRLGACLTPKIEGQGAGGRAPEHVGPLSDAAKGKIGRSATPELVKRQPEGQSGRWQVAPQLQELVIRRGVKLEGSDHKKQGVSNQESSKACGAEEDQGAVPKAVPLEASFRTGRLLDILSEEIEESARKVVEVTSVTPITSPGQRGAGEATGPPKPGIVGTPSPPTASPKTTTRASAKRKSDIQKVPCSEPGQDQALGGGKRARKLGNSSTPKRVSFRKILPKEDSHKPVGETGSPQGQGKITPGGGITEIKEERSEGEKPEVNNRGKGKDQKVSGTANLDQLSKGEKPPTLASQPLGHTKARTKVGPSPALLPVLEKALAKAKAKLAPQSPESRQNLVPQDNDDDRCVVWLLEDTIQKVKNGTYQPSRP